MANEDFRATLGRAFIARGGLIGSDHRLQRGSQARSNFGWVSWKLRGRL